MMKAFCAATAMTIAGSSVAADSVAGIVERFDATSGTDPICKITSGSTGATNVGEPVPRFTV